MKKSIQQISPDPPISAVGESCPECGNVYIDGLTCWEQLGAILAWETQDPQLQAEHFLTVASYNLQHPAQFMDDALAALRQSFIEYLDQGVTAQSLRRRASTLYDGSKRVLKREPERILVPRTWALTISHVYRPTQPAGAAVRVREWANSIRHEMD